LGFPPNLCADYHNQFTSKKITHNEWCKITLNNFREKKLSKKDLKEIANKIIFIKNLESLLKELENLNIKMYILSGSIVELIEAKLDSFENYFVDISANKFHFNREGLLKDIIGTKYDFKGKATFLKEVIIKEKIAPFEVLYVGNSINDIWAYESGVKTLCVNPINTNSYNRIQWRDSIQNMKSALEILNFVNK
jgi:phosphoserine phosphatase